MDHREIFIRGTFFFFFLVAGKGLQEIFRNYNLYYNRSKYELLVLTISFHNEILTYFYKA